MLEPLVRQRRARPTSALLNQRPHRLVPSRTDRTTRSRQISRPVLILPLQPRCRSLRLRCRHRRSKLGAVSPASKPPKIRLTKGSVVLHLLPIPFKRILNFPPMRCNSPSVTSSRTHVRRITHQPSPSPTRIPEQADTPSPPPVNPFRAQSFEHRASDSNLFDPFIVSSSDNESDSTPSPSKAGDKPAPIRTPALASRPSGKLARRRQGVHSDGSPVPSKAVPVPRTKGNGHSPTQCVRSEPISVISETPKRIAGHRLAAAFPVAEWDEFPVSDETLFSPPSTPVRPSASVPKRLGVTWQQTMLDEAPRTAPLSSSFIFPFVPVGPCATPSPAHRRRHHRRVPSEGVFAMSTDEESSTDSSDESKKTMNALPLFHHHAHVGARRTPSPPALESPAGFYAGSIFQNSPSPDDLPVPAFRV